MSTYIITVTPFNCMRHNSMSPLMHSCKNDVLLTTDVKCSQVLFNEITAMIINQRYKKKHHAQLTRFRNDCNRAIFNYYWPWKLNFSHTLIPATDRRLLASISAHNNLHRLLISTFIALDSIADNINNNCNLYSQNMM